ncbi:DNA translocase FtsK, partial [Methylobacterium gnaphalii]
MRSLRRSASPYDTFVDSFRPFMAKRLTEFGGLVLFAGAMAMIVALATWSIDDPSLNHATERAAHNVLGRAGAAVSDLAMQLLGLGSLAFALPPVLWGARLMREHNLPRGGLRLALWVIGFLASSAVASALPPTASWPLPTGLGGVAGDALLSVARLVVGAIAGPAAALVGILYAAIAILSLTGACRAGIGEEEEDFEEPVYANDRQSRHDADEPSLGILSLGALAQAVMNGRQALRARLTNFQAGRQVDDLAYAGSSPGAIAARRAFEDDPPWATQAQERVQSVGARREPTFDERSERRDERFEHAAEAPAPQASSRRMPAAQVQPDDEGEDFEEPPQAPRGRVSAPLPPAPPASPRPMPRGEPSEYRHPALELLALPRPAAPGSEISADALEQNATLLEATLSDFGVRGDILAVRPGPVVTLYELEPAPGTKSSRVISLADDIARSMSAISARVAVVPGRNAIGIELPNTKRETVFLRELLASQDFVGTQQKLALCLGKN